MSLRVFEQRYYELAKSCVANGEGFGIVTLNARNEVGGNQAFARVGTAVAIHSFDAPEPNIFVLDVVGEQRFEIVESRVRSNGLHLARVRWLPPEAKVAVRAEHAPLVALLRPVVEALGESRFAEPYDLDDATWVGSRLTEILQMPRAIKQSLLEINDAELRLKTLAQLVARGSAAAA